MTVRPYSQRPMTIRAEHSHQTRLSAAGSVRLVLHYVLRSGFVFGSCRLGMGFSETMQRAVTGRELVRATWKYLPLVRGGGYRGGRGRAARELQKRARSVAEEIALPVSDAGAR